ncbi:MAG TPA: hypothetical protein DDZ89_21240 [Clostridiales bacterium]|nr:hypothetical protein [Clostridiales bacterium]
MNIISWILYRTAISYTIMFDCNIKRNAFKRRQLMNALGNEKELVQNKLILLYILRKLDMPVTNRQLTQLVLSHRLMNYFIMQQMLLELIDSAYVDAQVDENKEQIKISQQGRDVLNYFMGMIPPYLKLKVDTKVLPESTVDKLTDYATAEYYPVGLDSFKILLNVNQDSENAMKITLTTNDLDYAKKIVKKWNEKSDQMADRIMDILNE